MFPSICKLSNDCLIVQSALHFVLYVRVLHRFLLIYDLFNFLDDSLHCPHVEKGRLLHGSLLTANLDLLSLIEEFFHIQDLHVSLLNMVKHILCQVSISLVMLKNCNFLNRLWHFLHDSRNKRLNLLLLYVSCDDIQLGPVIVRRRNHCLQQLS